MCAPKEDIVVGSRAEFEIRRHWSTHSRLIVEQAISRISVVSLPDANFNISILANECGPLYRRAHRIISMKIMARV